jgi:hypothetical protein
VSLGTDSTVGGHDTKIGISPSLKSQHPTSTATSLSMLVRDNRSWPFEHKTTIEEEWTQSLMNASIRQSLAIHVEAGRPSLAISSVVFPSRHSIKLLGSLPVVYGTNDWTGQSLPLYAPCRGSPSDRCTSENLFQWYLGFLIFRA